MLKKSSCLALLCASIATLTSCNATMPTLGGGNTGTTASGAAAGSNAENQNSQLESCDKTLGTLSLFEDTSLAWWNSYRRYYPNLGSTIPVIRMMVQQSNCFVIVERGAAMAAMQRERQLMSQGQLRGNSNFGQGQMVAADYTLSPSVQFKQSNLGKVSGYLNRLSPVKVPGSAAVGAKSNQASTTLLMIDNRSGVQVSSSVGSAKNFDFSIAGNFWKHGGGAGLSAFTSTPEGKVIIAAFTDSYNQMVKALRNYKPQKIEGGLGTGGALQVDGATSAVTPAKVAPAPAPVPRTVNTTNYTSSVTTSYRNHNVVIDDFDEDALDDYYKALKRSVEHLSQYSGWTAQQVQAVDAQAADYGGLWQMLWSSSFSGKLETSKIELESWPLSARQDGWASLGKRITKYNKLFNQHRDAIIANEAFNENIRTRLSNFELVTEQSLFAE